MDNGNSIQEQVYSTHNRKVDKKIQVNDPVFDEARSGLQLDIESQRSLKRRRPLTPVKTGYKNFYLYAAVDPVGGESFIHELNKAFSDRKIKI